MSAIENTSQGLDSDEESDWLIDTVKNGGAIVFADYTGMTVAEMTELRSTMKARGGQVRVTKSRLLRLSLERAGFDEIAHNPWNQAISLYASDPLAAFNTATQFSSSNGSLKIVGGIFGSQTLTASYIRALASLPSLNELRARIAWQLTAPALNVCRMLRQHGMHSELEIRAFLNLEDASAFSELISGAQKYLAFHGYQTLSNQFDRRSDES